MYARRGPTVMLTVPLKTGVKVTAVVVAVLKRSAYPVAPVEPVDPVEPVGPVAPLGPVVPV